ncbi:MAG TPA: hypothetical protein VFB59_00660 [Candidatus Saccharimonadales bacterium]|nr:hypothetical protein [Candidatus Saccharimonadales bacterium]
MDGKRMHTIMFGALIILGLVLVGSVYFANKALSDKSKELVGLRATKQAKEEQEKQLIKAKEDIKKYSDLNEIAKSVVPQDKDQAKTVAEIVDLASKSGIKRLSSVSFPPSTLGAAPPKEGEKTEGEADKPKTPAGLTQVTPVKGIGGVYRLQITVTQAANEPVTYSNFLNFLSKLEHNRRTAQVSSINVQPDNKNPDLVSFTLVISEYIKP